MYPDTPTTPHQHLRTPSDGQTSYFICTPSAEYEYKCQYRPFEAQPPPPSAFPPYAQFYEQCGADQRFELHLPVHVPILPVHVPTLPVHLPTHQHTHSQADPLSHHYHHPYPPNPQYLHAVPPPLQPAHHKPPSPHAAHPLLTQAPACHRTKPYPYLGKLQPQVDATFLTSPTPTPSLSPGTSPCYPFRSEPHVYWDYPYPLGHQPREDRERSEQTYTQLIAELTPHLGTATGSRIDILSVLQVLDELIVPCALVFSENAMIVWMRHLQESITAIKLRAFVDPLTNDEKDLILNFALYWVQKRGGACDMGRPETQIVLGSLIEVAQN